MNTLLYFNILWSILHVFTTVLTIELGEKIISPATDLINAGLSQSILLIGGAYHNTINSILVKETISNKSSNEFISKKTNRKRNQNSKPNYFYFRSDKSQESYNAKLELSKNFKAFKDGVLDTTSAMIGPNVISLVKELAVSAQSDLKTIADNIETASKTVLASYDEYIEPITSEILVFSTEMAIRSKSTISNFVKSSSPYVTKVYNSIDSISAFVPNLPIKESLSTFVHKSEKYVNQLSNEVTPATKIAILCVSISILIFFTSAYLIKRYYVSQEFDKKENVIIQQVPLIKQFSNNSSIAEDEESTSAYEARTQNFGSEFIRQLSAKQMSRGASFRSLGSLSKFPSRQASTTSLASVLNGHSYIYSNTPSFTNTPSFSNTPALSHAGSFNNANKTNPFVNISSTASVFAISNFKKDSVSDIVQESFQTLFKDSSNNAKFDFSSFRTGSVVSTKSSEFLKNYKVEQSNLGKNPFQKTPSFQAQIDRELFNKMSLFY